MKTSATLSGLLVLGLATATAIPALVARAPPRSGMNVCTVTNNTQPGQYCPFRGTVNKPGKAVNVAHGITFDDCRSGCLVNSPCQSFSYNSKTMTCKQYTKTVTQLQPGTPGGNTAYRDRTCYSATFYNDEAVVNPGFESGKLFPWIALTTPSGANGTVEIEPDGNASKYAVQMSSNNTGISTGPDLDVYITQFYYLCEGIEYSFSWDQYQIPGGSVVDNDNSCFPTVQVFLNSPDGSTLYSIAFGVSDDSFNGAGNTYGAGFWASFAIDFLPSVSGNYSTLFQVRACAGGATAFLFDNIETMVPS